MSGENVNRHNSNVQHNDNEGTRRPALTRTDILDYALVQLGFPVVEVEVSTQQTDAALKRAFDEYNKWLPVYKEDCLTATSSQVNQYNLLTMQKPFGRGVVDVRIVTKQQFFSPISGVFALGIPHPISHLAPDQYDLVRRYIGTAKKVYSSEMEWEWQEPVLWLYAPTGFGGPFNAAYTYIAECSVPEDIPAEDWGWFKDFTYNQIKRILGEVRSKFGTIPGPAAQTLRGPEMIKEANEEIKRLEEELRSKSYCRVPPLMPGTKG